MQSTLRLVGMALALCGCAARAAGVSPAELARCAGISESATRLTCYDALAHRVADGSTAPAASPPPTVKAAPPAAAAAPVAAPSAPAPNAVALDDPKNFGLTLNQLQRGQAQTQAPMQEVKSITARITSAGQGGGRLRIVLDNDQIWDVLDDDGRITTGLEVTIRKASLGSFLMSAAHRRYRVHRIS